MTEEERRFYESQMSGFSEEDWKQLIDANTRLRGLARKEHFAEGRTLEDWRGICRIQLDKRKEASKRACRNAHEVDD